MNTWRVLQGSQIPSCPRPLFFTLALLTVLAAPVSAQAQARGYPGPAARENNRSMDEYDRTINRMKNDARASNERRRNLFPEINEDFQRIQVVHNEIVRLLQSDKGLNYDRLADLTDDMRKRSIRLRENLALSEQEASAVQTTHQEPVDDSHIRKTISQLHDLVVDFVANPLFKNLGVVDAKAIDKASANLNEIIDISDEIKREARTLSKTARK